MLLHLQVLNGPHMFSSYARHKRDVTCLRIYASEGKAEANIWLHKLINLHTSNCFFA